MSELLTIEQAADRLAVTAHAVRKWVSQKRLPSVKLGRLTRLRLGDIERVAAEGLAPRGVALHSWRGRDH